MDKGVPFILQRTDGKPISNASPPRTTTDDDSPEGCISVQADNMNVKLDGIDPIVKKLLPLTFRAHWVSLSHYQCCASTSCVQFIS